jgi:hypothetical protein
VIRWLVFFFVPIKTIKYICAYIEYKHANIQYMHVYTYTVCIFRAYLLFSCSRDNRYLLSPLATSSIKTMNTALSAMVKLDEKTLGIWFALFSAARTAVAVVYDERVKMMPILTRARKQRLL